MGNLYQRVIRRIVLFFIFVITTVICWFSPSRKGKKYLPAIRDEVLLRPVTDLVREIKSRKLRAEHVVQAYIDRMNEVEPFVNGMVDKRFSEAILEARDIDDRLASGSAGDLLQKSLLGVPFVGKDHVAVKDLAWTCGLVARKGLVATEDADIIHNLKSEGAICIGVANVPELAFSVDCGNLLYGRTKNPYDLSRSPGGSTGGGAAVVASAAAAFAVGTDIGGSIRIPGFCCGVFGYKPSSFLIKTTGFWPPCPEEKEFLMAAGPICRNACDLSLIFRAMAGNDVISRKLPHFDDHVDLSKITIYTIMGTGHPLTQPTSRELRDRTIAAANFFHKEFRSEVRHLKKIQGFNKGFSIASEVFRDPKMPYGEKLTNGNGSISLTSEWLKKMFNLSNHTTAMLLLCTMDLFGNKDEKERQRKYHAAQKQLQELKQEFNHLMQGNAILLMPTLPVVATKHNETLLKYYNFTSPCLFNLMEAPVVQCPLGLSRDGLPLGIQIAAGNNQDHLCLAAAAALEKKFAGWISPSNVNLSHE